MKSLILPCCIKMSCHHECALHLLYSCYLFVPFRCCCEPVDQGVGVQPRYFDDPYYFSHQQGKRKSPSLSISLILCFPTSIFSMIILHTFPMSLVTIRVSYQLHKFHTHYLFSLLISIGLMCWPEYHYICYYTYA